MALVVSLLPFQAMLLGMTLAATGAPDPTPQPSTSLRSFAIETLSRGKGVPPEAREALRKVREIIEEDRNRGTRVRIQSQRLGIEGDTRLCAEYDDAKAAAQTYERAEVIVKGVDLTNLTKLVVGPCEKEVGKGGGQS